MATATKQRSTDTYVPRLKRLYEDEAKTPLQFDVRPGANKVDLPLTKRP